MTWPIRKLSELATFKNGLNFSRTDVGSEVKIIGVSDFQGGTRISSVDDLQTVQIKGPLRSDAFLRDGDLLFVRSNGNKALVGRCILVDVNGQEVSHSGFTIRARVTSDLVLPEYLLYLMQTSFLRSQLLQAGGGTNISNLSQATLGNLRIPVPSISEQTAITRMLRTWDAALDALARLITLKRERKRGLMQVLLTGKKRFSDFEDSAWHRVKLGNIVRRVQRPIEWDDNELYTLISLRRRSGGLFVRDRLFGSEIKTKKLNVALAGDFLISRMQVVHGATGLTTKDFDGMHISDSYISLVPTDKTLFDIRYLDLLSRTAAFKHKAYISSYGVHIEKMTFNLDLFLNEEFCIPSRIEEQRKIVETLAVADREVEILEEMLSAYKLQKRGLMQRLLAGEQRRPVKVLEPVGG